MRFILFIFIFCSNTFLYSQNKEMSYYFDSCTEYNLKQYDMNLFSKVYFFKNSKDSSYDMAIHQNKDSLFSRLFDYKKEILINFDVNFIYNNVEDLKKLQNIRLYNNVILNKKTKHKNYVEDFEYEIDSINNQTLVHITQYKNSKRKKIINEHYYFFSNNENIKNIDKNNMKDYLINKYNLLEIKNQNLEKTICVVDGKKQSEKEILKIMKIDYTLSFKTDTTFPKKNTFYKNRLIINTTTD